MPTDSVILTSRLSKSYPSKQVLHEIDLSVPGNTVYSLLAPDDSGKTTLIRILSGLLRQSSGDVKVLGYSPFTEGSKLRPLCGVVTRNAKMYSHLNALENLSFFGQLANLTQEDISDRSASLLRRLGLWEYREMAVSKYSAGSLVRLSLARALLLRPSLLLLDEPFSELDPDSAHLVREMITEENRERGVTVFITSSHPQYVEDLSSAFGVMRDGTLLASGSFDQLCRSFGLSSTAKFKLREGDHPVGYTFSDCWWQKPISSDDDMPIFLNDLIAQGCEVYEAGIVHPSLGSLYHFAIREETE